jgi:hypothetical protein
MLFDGQQLREIIRHTRSQIELRNEYGRAKTISGDPHHEREVGYARMCAAIGLTIHMSESAAIIKDFFRSILRNVAGTAYTTSGRSGGQGWEAT